MLPNFMPKRQRPLSICRASLAGRPAILPAGRAPFPTSGEKTRWILNNGVTNFTSRGKRWSAWQRILHAAAIIFLVGSATPSAAQNDHERLDSGTVVAPEESLRGLVVDRTVTFFGREFYGYFVDVWREQAGAAELNLVIYERPDPRFGSEVTIEFERNVEFRAFISPTRSRTRALAENAASGLAQKLSEVLQRRRNGGERDLGADEL